MATASETFFASAIDVGVSGFCAISERGAPLLFCPFFVDLFALIDFCLVFLMCRTLIAPWSMEDQERRHGGKKVA